MFGWSLCVDEDDRDIEWTGVRLLMDDCALVSVLMSDTQLMRHMFSTQHVWIPSDNIGSRYMYSIALQEYLHRSETPLARTRRTGIETPPRTVLQYRGTTEKKDENVWISKTVKRAKDRDQRRSARENLKKRLTKKSKTASTPPPTTKETEKDIFESDDEVEEENTVMEDERKAEDNDEDERKDDDNDEVLSRLRQ
jgi:hypothetical protein